MENEKVLELINDYMKKNEFIKCNSLLKKVIVYIYTNKVRKFNNDYYYSTPVELLEQVEKYLSYDECIVYNRFYYTLNEDLMDHERANKLIELYKKIINLDTNNK